MTVLLAGLSGSLAHASRLVAVARALQGRDREVHLGGGPGFLDDPVLVASGEFARHPLAEPGLGEVLGQARGADWFARALEEDRALIRRLGCRVVVFDNRRSAGVAARLEGVRSVSLTNAPLLGPHLGWSPSVESFLGLLAPVMGLDPARLQGSPALAGRAPSDAMPLQAGPLPARLRETLSRLGAPVPPALHHLSLGDRTAVCDHPLLHPLTDPPEGVEPVGPLLPTLRAERPGWWDEVDAERPCVLVSFGSTGPVDAQGVVVAALMALGVQVLVTGSEVVSPSQGLFGARWLPGGEASARADLVVCHGGSGTVYQALEAGTPVVCLPGHLEQALNGLAAARQGVGVTVAARAAVGSPTELQALLGRCLDDTRLQARARALSGRLEPGATASRVATMVEELL